MERTKARRKAGEGEAFRSVAHHPLPRYMYSSKFPSITGPNPVRPNCIGHPRHRHVRMPSPLVVQMAGGVLFGAWPGTTQCPVER